MVRNAAKKTIRTKTLNVPTPGERDSTNIEKLLLLIRKSPRRWWLYSGLLVAPFLCVILLIRPVLSAPLLPKSQPRQHKALEDLLAKAAKLWSAEDFAAVRASCLKAMAMPGARPRFQSYAHLRLAQSYLAETNPAAAKTDYGKIMASTAYPEVHCYEAEECAK